MSIYSPAWFAASRDGMRASAEVVVDTALKLLLGTPRRVVDVGCGEGWWALEFAKHGAEVLGIDGDYVISHQLGDRFLAHDLDKPLPDLGEFDVAVCMEVAEHLEPSRAESLVADLCRLAPVVLFSAAIPGQGGNGHIHCRWPSYWADLFEAHGYGLDDSIRWRVWDDERVQCWYRQNVHLAVRGAIRRTHDVVHPQLWSEVTR